MQQFVVPQFIDVEDKIIGPITTRQFIVMLSGFLIMAVAYKLFDFSLFVTFSLLVFAVSGMFAFLKINGRPFHYFVLNLFQTLKKPKLRVWHNRLIVIEADYGSKENNIFKAAADVPEKHYTTSRLAELSLMVDTKGAYRAESDQSSVGEIKNVEREM